MKAKQASVFTFLNSISSNDQEDDSGTRYGTTEWSTDRLQTSSSHEQHGVEECCAECYYRALNKLSCQDSGEADLLVVFWISHSLDLLDDFDTFKWGPRIIEFVNSAWDDRQGGYGGGTTQLAHLAPTYAAVASLIIAGQPEAYQSINRRRLYKCFMSLKDPDAGGFFVHEDGEIDMRSAYCAVSVASVVGILTDDLTQGLAEYIVRCQTWEGGIAGEEGMEAHGGYTYCGLATLCILKKAHLLDLDLLLEWAVSRQMGFEGGFQVFFTNNALADDTQGRTNKLVDSCYSFWVGAIFPLLREAFRQCNKEFPLDHQWFYTDPLQLYILLCCQTECGGLRDKPQRPPDFYHTCYALSGLSLGQNCRYDGLAEPFGSTNNYLSRTDPLYNIRTDKLEKAKQYFSNKPFVVPLDDV